MPDAKRLKELEVENARFKKLLAESLLVNEVTRDVTSLPHAKVVIEAWRREYNEERPKKSLGGLTPASYARKLAEKAVTLNPRL